MGDLQAQPTFSEIAAQLLMPQFSHISSPSPAPVRGLSRRYRVMVLMAFTALAMLLQYSRSGAEPVIGQPAPDFALRALNAANVRLSEHRGEVVLVNFWATWCGPCRQQMPVLNDLYQKYQRAGLTLFGANIDAPAAQAAEMAHTLKVSYPILIDDRQEVGKLYQIGSMPLIVLIDRQGVVRYVSQGFKPGDEKRYADWLRELLNE